MPFLFSLMCVCKLYEYYSLTSNLSAAPANCTSCALVSPGRLNVSDMGAEKVSMGGKPIR